MRDAPLPAGRVFNFASCGTSHWVLRSRDDPTQFRVVPSFCHDRFCVPCGASRQAIVRRNLATRLRDGPHRFLTLTVRNTTGSLADLVKHLYDSFRRLRNRGIWKRHVTGGAAFLEVTWNEERGSWHPHLHCMLEGRYVDLQDLKQAWLAVTGDSHALHIRLIREKTSVINYVSKYATKPLSSSILANPWALDHALTALTGTRMILPFGTWKAWKLLDDPKDAGWELFDHLDAVTHRAGCEESLCVNILAMLDTADPNTGVFTVIDDGVPIET